MSNEESAKKVAELIDGERIAMLTTLDNQGALTSRPMGLQEVEFDGDLWFFAEADSPAVTHIAAQPKVNVSVSGSSTWVSLAGHASVVDDSTKKHELWNKGVEAWLPEGPDGPNVTLIKVEGDSAEYWDTPGKVATAISFVKAKATGEPFTGGDKATVDL